MVKTQNFCPPEVDDISLRKNKGLESILRDMIMSQLVLSDLTEEVNMSGDTGKTPKSFTPLFGTSPYPEQMLITPPPANPCPSHSTRENIKSKTKKRKT